MRKTSCVLAALLSFVQLGFSADTQQQTDKKSSPLHVSSLTSQSFTPFTGKIIGESVRLRTQPSLEGEIVYQLDRGDYVAITGQKGDFFAVVPPKSVKAYIFRGFVIDGVVEGDRVNVRLSPNREAPIIGQYDSGVKIPEHISQTHPKWLEIPVPPNARFYIAKDYVEYAGDLSFKEKHDEKQEKGKAQLKNAQITAQNELAKPFPSIVFEKIKQAYRDVMETYADFPTYVEQAKKEEANAYEKYLHLKISYLESQTQKLSKEDPSLSIAKEDKSKQKELSIPQKISTTHPISSFTNHWESVEKNLYLEWREKHSRQNEDSTKKDDFYQSQKIAMGTTLQGTITPFPLSNVRNKPGDFLLKDGDLPIAYLYSTQINLADYLDKEVALVALPRPNHRFAFPAFYVLEVR